VSKIRTSKPSSRKKASSRSKAKKTVSKKIVSPPKLLEIFEDAGFLHIVSEKKEFSINGQNGEIDYIFLFKNVVILCEETAGNDVSHHLPKKIVFHKLINSNKKIFFDSFCEQSPEFKSYFSGDYEWNDLEVRHVYFSEKVDVSEGGISNSDPFKIMTIQDAFYFKSLSKIIQKSSRYELLNYLKVRMSDVGFSRVAGRGVSSDSFPGFVLPQNHTKYPDGFSIVTFYADPLALITRAYVLRRDGWEDPDLSYQRFIQGDKLHSMREYLSKDGKVFINNLIVTLPDEALLKKKNGDIIDINSVSKTTEICLDLPQELATIGIIDGQHRVFSYFEGKDDIDSKIAILRSRQNLLVTGIIFPKSYSKENKIKFEAELFLSINDNQTRVNTQLRQDLATLIKPETSLAIARVVINNLADNGALSGKLQISQFDPTDRIAAGSLAPYVGIQLVQVGSPLHTEWSGGSYKDLADISNRENYIKYCTDELRKILGALAKIFAHNWKSKQNGGILSTTVVGGFIALWVNW